jgi:long-chain acyl-CoA synthetase
MLVPVQYQRLMARPDFDALRPGQLPHEVQHQRAVQRGAEGRCAEALARRLVEFYGMTEGGGTCILEAHLHPDKLHTVGRPAEGHDLRLIDEAGVEVRPARPARWWATPAA